MDEQVTKRATPIVHHFVAKRVNGPANESQGQVFDSFPNITWQMPVPPRIMFHNHYMFDAKVGI